MTYGVSGSYEGARNETDEMSESASDHRLEGVGGGGGVAGDHRVRGHDGADGGRSRIESISDDLSHVACRIVSRITQHCGRRTYAESEILGGEDTAEVFLIVDDEDAVGSFRGAELGSIRDGDVVRDGESGEGS